jgi:hypothetical protein
VFANLPATVRRPPSPDRPLLLLHSGTMYPDERDPSTLFRALRRLVDSGRIRPGQLVLRFRASGHDGNLLARAAEAQVSEFVEVSPPAGYREALAEMMTADGLFVVQSADCNDQIPPSSMNICARNGRFSAGRSAVTPRDCSGRPVRRTSAPSNRSRRSLRRWKDSWFHSVKVLPCDHMRR